jgi:hypothetical protein
MRNRKSMVFLLTVIVAIVACLAYLVWRGSDEVAHLEPGMVTLHLPGGATAYVPSIRLWRDLSQLRVRVIVRQD